MNNLVKAVGGVLVESGQALQRAGLRAADHVVVPHQPFNWVGVAPPALGPGVSVAPSASLLGKEVMIGARSEIGENVVIHGEDQTVVLGIAVKVGSDSVITSMTKRSLTGLPTSTEIGSDVVIGERCVLESCLVGSGAKIGDDCVVSAGSYVEGGAELLPGTVVPSMSRIPSDQVWGGNPAAFVGDVEAH
ncbi:Gamma carbonic anhydrase 3, mitochondrial [Hondaea fermentalgiana]|uniref:Gamma carbonic anhydrase 3, mitochondrial n=1 Tax=Hondaea fermentalgiana TaxID=2315210 RepID=A0A2R5GJN4_9STRA|nr:Gamma carbonic anhydrase 3, mitochondrial [Hondaea fermentalgiana]|eukprot:GBG30835.1 Gamma carbonic anhydrase 3, mitochondrial [Hondaea fermentalgiana]